MRYFFGLLNTLASGVVAFVVFIIGAMACSDGCRNSADAHWSDRESAWQWDAIILLGTLQLVVAGVFYLFIVARRRRMCISLLGLQALTAAALIVLVAGAGWPYSDAVVAGAPVLLGALAIRVTSFSAPSGPRTPASASP
jgi:hypothetical protein